MTTRAVRTSALAATIVSASLFGAANANAQEWTFGWGPSSPMDHGYNPSVAMAGATIVEVHNGTGGAGPLWYSVGFDNGMTIGWNNSQPYDNNGFNPSVAMGGSTVVEVHNGGAGAGPLWYRVGQLAGATIAWNPSQSYGSGYNPSVAVVGTTVFEVHNGAGTAGTMWYRVGQISGGTIAWNSNSSLPYDYGFNPSVAAYPCVNKNNTSCGVNLIEVHNGSTVAGPLWYRIGNWNGGPVIGWQGSIQYDQGWNPKVAFWSNSEVLEVHNGRQGAGPLWWHTAQFEGPTSPLPVNWGVSTQYDSGYNPAVAIFNGGAVEVHDGVAGAGPLLCHLGAYVPFYQ